MAPAPGLPSEGQRPVRCSPCVSSPGWGCLPCVGWWPAHGPSPLPHPRSTRWPEECPLTEMGGILGTSDRVPKLRGGCVQCISPVSSRVDIFILGVVVLDLQVGADTLFSGDCRQGGDSGRALGTRGQSGLPVGWCSTVLLSESHLLGLARWLVCVRSGCPATVMPPPAYGARGRWGEAGVGSSTRVRSLPLVSRSRGGCDNPLT